MPAGDDRRLGTRRRHQFSGSVSVTIKRLVLFLTIILNTQNLNTSLAVAGESFILGTVVSISTAEHVLNDSIECTY